MSGETPFIRAFDEIIASSFTEYLNLSNSIGDLVKLHAEMVKKLIDAQRQFLLIAAQSKQPKTNEQLSTLLKSTSDNIQAVQNFREKNRTSSFFAHLSAISESITAFGWVTISPAPAPFVKEMIDASQFYTNKVLIAYKDKDKRHCDWSRAWLSFLNDLQKYVKQHHTTGLTWNPKGSDSVLNAQNGASCGAPPPPPPPPANLFSGESVGAGGDDDARQALMRELNKGTDITRGLKKVSADQQTHKNPALRNQATVNEPGAGNVKATTGTGRATAASVSQKAPKFELEGKKWMIEYQNNAGQLTVECEEMNQSVSIYQCNNTVVTIKGKANSITVDSCKKVGFVFEDIVSFVELINCQSTQAQSLGHVPTINIEKSDSIQVYLSAKSINAEIVTAKSSSINVSVPDKTGDFAEYPLPEQFKSLWTGKGFKTEPTDIAG